MVAKMTSRSRSSSDTTVAAENGHNEKDIEAQRDTAERPETPDSDFHQLQLVKSQALIQHPPHIKLVFDQTLVTDAVLTHPYRGSGTTEDPYIVEFIPNDPRNPMLFATWKKWAITMLVAIATLAVAFVSSAFSGGVRQIIAEFQCSQEVVTLGISLFVLGFAIGEFFVSVKQCFVSNNQQDLYCGRLYPSSTDDSGCSLAPMLCSLSSMLVPLDLRTFRL